MADTQTEQALQALQAVQDYDLNVFPTKESLGPFNFEAALAPAFRIVGLFKRVPAEILQDFPQGSREKIGNLSNEQLNLFGRIVNFDTSQNNPSEARLALIREVEQRYDPVFTQLHPWISYAASKTTDFAGLTAEARRTIDAIESLRRDIVARTSEAEKRVADLEEQLRQSLAKQGVGKQAQYFEGEANKHASEANKWGQRTWRWSIAVTVVAIASFFTHRIPWLAPEDTTEAIQFIASKLLLFGVLTFMLVRSSRNYLAHKHNEVINRHKQNSLLTFNALVEAGATPEARNVVLNQAAGSIYETPSSGYVKSGADGGPSNTTLVEMIPRMLPRTGDGHS